MEMFIMGFCLACGAMAVYLWRDHKHGKVVLAECNTVRVMLTEQEKKNVEILGWYKASQNSQREIVDIVMKQKLAFEEMVIKLGEPTAEIEGIKTIIKYYQSAFETDFNEYSKQCESVKLKLESVERSQHRISKSQSYLEGLYNSGKGGPIEITIIDKPKVKPRSEMMKKINKQMDDLNQ